MATDSVQHQRMSTAKGPLVWLDMDQRELDDAYDQTVYAPNQPLLAARRKVASESVLKRFPPERRAYGSSEIEKLDIYKTAKPNAPVMVFTHGGAWRNGTAKDAAFQAEMYMNAGANLVIVDFVQVQDAGGSLLPMIQQVRSAVAWVYKNASSFGADPDRIFLFLASHPAPTSPAACWLPIGKRNSACRQTSSQADCWLAACTT